MRPQFIHRMTERGTLEFGPVPSFIQTTKGRMRWQIEDHTLWIEPRQITLRVRPVVDDPTVHRVANFKETFEVLYRGREVGLVHHIRLPVLTPMIMVMIVVPGLIPFLVVVPVPAWPMLDKESTRQVHRLHPWSVQSQRVVPIEMDNVVEAKKR